MAAHEEEEDPARMLLAAAWYQVMARNPWIRIAPDAATTVNDLNYEGFSDPRGSAAGAWSRHPGPGATDLIRFSKTRMDTYAPATRRMAAAHELGHALGVVCGSGARPPVSAAPSYSAASP
ncbi:hypothetical protein ACIQZO_05900 [Streptomyces sp. NPDC097617]|uniref:hypothetical protein n=1 Tax=Streptomyces sp. NPDC097617 TaxID=3366091 RepID=UPI0037F52B99